MHALARGFSRQHRHTNYHHNMVSASRLTLIRGADFPTPQATRLHSNPIRKPSYHSASPHHLTTTHEDPTHPHTPTKKTSARRRAVSTIRFITCRTHTGTGISTRHPSTTPVGLVLGPDSPRADPPGPGTLGHSALGTLTLVIATHACILTPTPSTPGSLPGFTQRRTLPYHPSSRRSPRLRRHA